jgi:hypothetical protein
MTTIEEILVSKGIVLSDIVDFPSGELVVINDMDRQNSVYLGMPQVDQSGLILKATSRFEVNEIPKLLLLDYELTRADETVSDGRSFALLESETKLLLRLLKSDLSIKPICSAMDLRRTRTGTKYKQIVETNHGVVLVEANVLLEDDYALEAISGYSGLLQGVTNVDGELAYIGEKAVALSKEYGGLLEKFGELSHGQKFDDAHNFLTSSAFIQDYFEHCGVNFDSIRVTSYSYANEITPTIQGLSAMEVIAVQEKFGFPLPEMLILYINKACGVSNKFIGLFEEGLEYCLGDLTNIVTATSKTVFANDSDFSLSGKARPAYVRETKYYCQNVTTD